MTIQSDIYNKRCIEYATLNDIQSTYVVVVSAEEPWNWCIEGEAKKQLDEKFEVIGWF